jgi:hypothetical protein
LQNCLALAPQSISGKHTTQSPTAADYFYQHIEYFFL